MLNSIITNRPLRPGTASFLIRSLNMHLQTWCQREEGRNARIVQIGDLMYLETDSSEVLQNYTKFEAPFVRFLLETEELDSDWWDAEEAA